MYCYIYLRTCPKISLFFFFSFSCLKIFLYLFLKCKLFHKSTGAGKMALEGFREQESKAEDLPKSCFSRNGGECGVSTRWLLPSVCWESLLLTSVDVWLLFICCFAKKSGHLQRLWKNNVSHLNLLEFELTKISSNTRLIQAGRQHLSDSHQSF